MAEFLKASSTTRSLYITTYRKRRIPLPFSLCRTFHRSRSVNSLDLKSFHRYSDRRFPRIVRRCTSYTTQLPPMSSTRSEEWLAAATMPSHSSSNLKSLPTEHLSDSSAQWLLSRESTLSAMAHTLLNSLLEPKIR